MEQEKKYVFSQFLHSDAYKLGNYISGLAVEKHYPVAIEIEINGNVIYRYVNDGASANNLFWIKRKKNVVNRFQMSSGALTAKLAERGTSFREKYGDDTDYAVTPGAFPIRVKGVGMIGTVGISGLDSDSDHALIIDGFDYFFKEKCE
jgi:uncharacterized protein (UPF0303 family)